MHLLFLSCLKATELIEKKMHFKLSFGERLQLSVHKAMCDACRNPNFADFAINCGALGISVEKMEDLETAMQQIKDHDGPALLEVICDVSLI